MRHVFSSKKRVSSRRGPLRLQVSLLHLSEAEHRLPRPVLRRLPHTRAGGPHSCGGLSCCLPNHWRPFRAARRCLLALLLPLPSLPQWRCCPSPPTALQHCVNTKRDAQRLPLVRVGDYWRPVKYPRAEERRVIKTVMHPHYNVIRGTKDVGNNGAQGPLGGLPQGGRVCTWGGRDRPCCCMLLPCQPSSPPPL